MNIELGSTHSLHRFACISCGGGESWWTRSFAWLTWSTWIITSHLSLRSRRSWRLNRGGTNNGPVRLLKSRYGRGEYASSEKPCQTGGASLRHSSSFFCIALWYSRASCIFVNHDTLTCLILTWFHSVRKASSFLYSPHYPHSRCWSSRSYSLSRSFSSTFLLTGHRQSKLFRIRVVKRKCGFEWGVVIGKEDLYFRYFFSFKPFQQ